MRNNEKHNSPLRYALRPVEDALRQRVEEQMIKTEGERKYRQAWGKLAAPEGRNRDAPPAGPVPDAAPEARP